MDITIRDLVTTLNKVKELEARIDALEASKSAFIPLKEFCERYKVSRITVWNWAKKRLIQTRRIGRKLFVLDDLSRRTGYEHTKS